MVKVSDSFVSVLMGMSVKVLCLSFVLIFVVGMVVYVMSVYWVECLRVMSWLLLMNFMELCLFRWLSYFCFMVLWLMMVFCDMVENMFSVILGLLVNMLSGWWVRMVVE